MTRKRHTEEQIIAVLKDAQAGIGVQELCRKHGISDATFYKWRDEICRARSQRCEETAPAGRRKPAVETDGGGASAGHPGAEGHHRKKLVRPKAKRAAAQGVVARFGLSQRRVCRFVALDRNTLRYRSRRQDDAAPCGRGCERLPRRKRRYGCPRIYVRLATGRLARESQEGGAALSGRRALVAAPGGKKSAAVPRVALPLPTEPGRCYAMDFVHDRLVNGRRFKCLTMTDPCSKEVPVIEVDVSIGGARVCRILDRLFLDATIAGDRDSRQRPRIRWHRLGCVGRSARRAAALHSAGKAGAECIYRELQRQVSG